MITTTQFENAITEANEITKWRDLEVGTIYEIVDYDVFDIGKSMKLTLRDSDGLHIVWAPPRVKQKLEQGDYTHIRNNGLKDTKNGAKYWSFNAVFFK
jgi:hypothetical protein